MSIFDTVTKTLLHEEAIIGGVLSHLHGAGEAARLAKIASEANPLVSFGKRIGGELHYGQEISEACLEQVRIKVKPAAEEPYRYFKRIAACDGTKAAASGSGFNASAWVETNAQGSVLALENKKYPLRVCYPGYTNSTQTTSMLATLHGEFYQAREVGSFLDQTMHAAKGMDIPIDGVINNSWSMGAANALSSNLYFKHRNVPTLALLGDEWQACKAVHNISMRSNILRPLLGGSHADALNYSQSQLRKILAEDVISLYPALENGKGGWTRTSSTAPGVFPIMDKLSGRQTVGRVFHVDAKNMEVLESLPLLGNTHFRANVINHLVKNGAEALHEMPYVAAGKSVGRGIM